MIENTSNLDHTKLMGTRIGEGLNERHLHLIKQHANMKPYKVGDSIETVAWREGQQVLIDFIEHKLLTGKI